MAYIVKSVWRIHQKCPRSNLSIVRRRTNPRVREVASIGSEFCRGAL